MEHLYESTLIDTIDGIQCKVYSNSHPSGRIIVKPKYIPKDKADFVGLKYRFMFSKAMYRFNLFTDKETVNKNIAEFKEKFPDYFYSCNNHKNWFLVVPKEKIKGIRDPRVGLKELMEIPKKDLDDYLLSVKELIELIQKSGVSLEKLGINHSTLIGNYTQGKSDIDIVVYGKKNGWKVVDFLGKVDDPRLKWKTEEDWRKYYKDRIVSKVFSEEEYIANMIQKKDDGFFNNNVFSIFVVEEPEECWYNWEDNHIPLGIVKIRATVTDEYDSIVRPGYYKIKDSEIIEGNMDVLIEKIVTWSRPFNLQAKKGDLVECCGLLERVTTKSGETFYQIVLGYFDTYINKRGELEYLKKII